MYSRMARNSSANWLLLQNLVTRERGMEIIYPGPEADGPQCKVGQMVEQRALPMFLVVNVPKSLYNIGSRHHGTCDMVLPHVACKKPPCQLFGCLTS